MKFFIAILLSSFFLSGSYASVVCSEMSNVCMTYEAERPFNTNEEGRFSLKFTGAEVELQKVDLWMQMGNHGHGSSPLKVVRVSPFDFDVTKAFFVMKGLWQIRAKYKINDILETLTISVDIKN